MGRSRDELDVGPLTDNAPSPHNLIFRIGNRVHEDFPIPYEIALQTTCLAQYIPVPYRGAPIRLPDVDAHDFRRYSNFLLFTLPLAKLVARDPARAFPPRGHPLEHKLTWVECLPLIKAYVFAERIGDEAFLCYIRFELEAWLASKQQKDLTALQYVVTAEGVSQELKTWVVSRTFRTVDEVPDLLRGFWHADLRQEELLRPEQDDSILAEDSGIAPRRVASGAVNSAMSPPRQRRPAPSSAALPPRPYSEVHHEESDTITALPKFPGRHTRPSSERFKEGIPRLGSKDATMTLGEVRSKLAKWEEGHGVRSQVTRIADGRKIKGPKERRKRVSLQFLKGFVEARGAPVTGTQRRGAQLWTPLV